MNKITHIKVYAPHNYKSGELILGKFRIKDVLILVSAFILFVAVLLMNMFLIEFNIPIILFFGVIIPIIMFFLVQPLRAYHNNLEYIRIMILYHINHCCYTGLVYPLSTKKSIKQIMMRSKK